MKQTIFLYSVCLGICLGQLPESLVNEEKCERLGGQGTYEKVKAADAEAKACIQELFDISTIQNEVDKGRETGTWNKVLGRYSGKGPQVNICIKNKIEMIKFCLTKEEKKQYNTVIEILRKVADYIYENDGERVITFVEKGGIECLKLRLDEVKNCFGDNLLTLLDPQIGRCKDYDQVKNCVVRELETNCPSSVPANITNDLLKFARTSICSNNKIIRSRRSSRRMVRDLGADRLPQIKKSLLESCKPTETELKRSFDILDVCVKEKEIFITEKEEFIKHTRKCRGPIIKELEACLPENLRYFPKFLSELVDSVLNLLYDDFDEIRFGVGPCLPNIKSEESELQYHRCIHALGADNDNTIPKSKKAFCDKFLPITKCFTQQLNQTCEHNTELKKFMKDYHKAMEDPCAP